MLNSKEQSFCKDVKCFQSILIYLFYLDIFNNKERIYSTEIIIWNGSKKLAISQEMKSQIKKVWENGQS
jgi:hypothetical protein